MQRNIKIDILKFVFTIIIVIYHSILMTDNRYLPIFQRGYLAVEFFFIVSGYLMANSVAKKDGVAPARLGRECVLFIISKVRILFLYYLIAWCISFIIVHCGYKVTLQRIINDALNAVWPFFFINMTGLDGFETVGAVWYISAMLIAMMFIYPLMRAKPDLFTCVIAPLLVIFIYGYLSKTFSGTVDPYKWISILGFGIYGGILRALAGLSLGCICFGIAQQIKSLHLTKFTKTLLAIIEFVLYFSAVYALLWSSNSRSDYLVILLFALGITLSFSFPSIHFPYIPYPSLLLSNKNLALYIFN